ncbi:hypothetical protein [Aquimarina sp. 2201CG14-23]|uniref:hypothetical protein n=1 Tax=Aquimarina mycalae TaxID=3040073 RepID=UPI0024781169|nr:hypothetical protein [Aquimarina sp. 2201CG14-23]MDH7444934.1 hypothetical protein [Aquimarina sp. 2201CG14-23]
MKSIVLLLLLFTHMTYSQHTDQQKEVQKLVALGRAHIISVALDQIQEDAGHTITKDDFHFITVKASDKRILVNFGYNVMYLPKNSSYYSDFVVELPSKSVSMTSESNESDHTVFYRPTSVHLSVINFIMDSDGRTSRDIFNRGVRFSPTFIYEKEKHYLVDFSARDPYLGGGFSKEEIDKETGEVLSTLSGHYAAAPKIPSIASEEEEEFEEITND